jgi:hypothetical protein
MCKYIDRKELSNFAESENAKDPDVLLHNREMRLLERKEKSIYINTQEGAY